MVRLYDVERQAAYTKGSVFLYTLGTWCVLPLCRWLCAEPWLFESYRLPDLILLVCAEHFDLTRGPS